LFAGKKKQPELLRELKGFPGSNAQEARPIFLGGRAYRDAGQLIQARDLDQGFLKLSPAASAHPAEESLGRGAHPPRTN